MIKARIVSMHSQRRGFLFAVLTCTMTLLFSYIFMSLPTQAFANDAPATQSEEQALAGNENDTPGYKVYALPNHQETIVQTDQATGIPDEEIPLLGTPLFAQDANKTVGSGSIFNTLVAALCTITMLGMLFNLAARKGKDYRVITLRTIAIAFSLATVAVWSLVDKFAFPSTFFNSMSLVIAVLFGLYVVLSLTSFAYDAHLRKAVFEGTR